MQNTQSGHEIAYTDPLSRHEKHHSPNSDYRACRAKIRNCATKLGGQNTQYIYIMPAQYQADPPKRAERCRKCRRRFPRKPEQRRHIARAHCTIYVYNACTTRDRLRRRGARRSRKNPKNADRRRNARFRALHSRLRPPSCRYGGAGSTYSPHTPLRRSFAAQRSVPCHRSSIYQTFPKTGG